MASAAGDWVSNNPAFAISRGTCRAQPSAPSSWLRFDGMLMFPLVFTVRSAVDPGVCCSGLPPFCKRNQLRADTAHHDVPPICDLHRIWSTALCGAGVNAISVPADDLHTGMII